VVTTTLKAEAEGRDGAARFRRNRHLGSQPLGDLVALIEQTTRVDVAVLDVGPDEHGMAMRDPKRGAVFIGVARTRRPMRQRSTLAHELGHVVFDDWAADGDIDWSTRSPVEIRADAFARHLLLPLDGLREMLGPPGDLDPSVLSAIVQRYLVSPAIAAIALEQLGRIDATTKREWMALSTSHLAVRFGWSDQYRALVADADQRRAPQRLLARVIRGYAEGVLPAQAVATLRGVPAETAARELREAGVVPAHHAVAWADPAQLPDVDVDLGALDEALGPAAEPEPE
jgi:Zn-dependent peptidase ImmA (M78 family)